jgi:hypothetical protein
MQYIYIFFVFSIYNAKKMKGLNNKLIGRPYWKKTNTSQIGYQEETTQTSVQGQQNGKNDKKGVLPNNSPIKHLPITL